MWIFLIIISLNGLAGIPSSTTWECPKEVSDSVLKLSKSKQLKWIKIRSIEGFPSYKTSISLGTWAFLEKNGNKSESLILKSSENEIEYRFSKKTDCYPLVNFKKSDREKSHLIYFTDLDLEKSLKKNPDMIFLVWSPHMRLSEKAIHELKKINLSFEPILDPLADHEEALKFVKSNGLSENFLRRAKSNELNQRNALNHYPALIVAQNGKLCSEVQRGYRKSLKYDLIIKDMRAHCL